MSREIVTVNFRAKKDKKAILWTHDPALACWKRTASMVPIFRSTIAVSIGKLLRARKAKKATWAMRAIRAGLVHRECLAHLGRRAPRECPDKRTTRRDLVIKRLEEYVWKRDFVQLLGGGLSNDI